MRIIPYEKSFASVEKSKYLSDANQFKAHEKARTSHVKGLFNCPDCGHKNIPMALGNVATGHWDPYCANRDICGDPNCEYCKKNSIVSHLHVNEWLPTNPPPHTVFKGTYTEYDWQCKDCNHILHKSPHQGKVTWCKYCHGHLCNSLECNTCYHNSAEYYISQKDKPFTFILADTEFNKGIDLRFTSHGSKRLADWKCIKCNHISRKSVCAIMDSGDRGGQNCVHCSLGGKLCEDINCSHCYSRSCISVCPEIILWWNASKNAHKLDRILPTADIPKCWFTCPNCKHDYDMPLRAFTALGQRCPFCSSHRLCQASANCKTCLSKTVAGSNKAHLYSDKNTTPAGEVFKSSAAPKRLWKCEQGCEDYLAIPGNVIGKGSGCPSCFLKTERKLYEWCCKHFKDVIQTFTLKGLKSKKDRPLRFDILINGHKVILELDGPQHFVQVSDWDDYRETQNTDIIKMNFAESEGYKIIRIYQPDVLNASDDWLDRVLLPEIINTDRTPVFISTEPTLYDIHIKKYRGEPTDDLTNELIME
jgi:very-short-patch-repair endonuclease